MANISNLETLAKLVNTTPGLLYRAALQVTELPNLQKVPRWLEERLTVACLAYATHFFSSPGLDLQTWLRRTLSFVVGPMPDSSDAEFYKACAESFKKFKRDRSGQGVRLRVSSDDPDCLVVHDRIGDLFERVRSLSMLLHESTHSIPGRTTNFGYLTGS
jgi:hypothetical protein